jgi:hypothetical protein
MRTVPIRLAFITTFGACAAYSQNSDLALLAGGTISTFHEQISATSIVSSGTGSVSYQINYAWQLPLPSGDVYIEIPLILAAGTGSARISPTTVIGSIHGTFFLTPGIRYRHLVHQRVSLYGAAGVGVGWFGTERATIGPNVDVVSTVTASPVFDFGGGLDVRLTRLLSLRGESRDFISRQGLGGTTGRNHVMFQAGFAFHF